MIRRRRAGCRQHADALLEYAAAGTLTPETSAALAHLERCPSCERDLAATALVVTALRRVGDADRRIEPPGNGWDRLERRLAQPAPVSQRTWRASLRGWLAPLAGALLAPMMLVGLLTAPAIFQSPGPTGSGDAEASQAAGTALVAPIASAGPVVVGDSLATGGGHAVVPGNVSELEGTALTPVVTPAPSPASVTDPPQLPLRAAPPRTVGVGPV